MAKYLAVVLSTVLLWSCDQDASHVLPRYTGAPGEVICVMSESAYESRAGDIVHLFLGENRTSLPQAEPMFDVIQMNPSQVNQITQQHRNLLYVHLSSPDDEEPRVVAQRNKWASMQMVITVYASSINEFDSLMAENGPSIVDKFNEFERKRLQSLYDSRSHRGVSETLQERGIELVVPSDCSIAETEERFVWIERQREKSVGGTMHDVLQGVLVYYYPYTSDNAFTAEQILQVRDSVLKQHVPGPVEGSYMTTEYRLPPQSEAVNFNGSFAVETRGLWRTEGAIMGGPFISLTTLDEENQRVVTAEGFVFAPKFNKREYVREIEAMIYSLDFPSSEPENE